MSNQRFTAEFKNEAFRLVIERGYLLAQVSACMPKYH
jgi:transposase-like protein